MSAAKKIKKSGNVLQQINKDFKQAGAEYVGSMVWFRCSVEDVEVKALRNMIKSDPRLDDDWSPGTLNNLTLYLQTVSELGRSSLRKFVTEFDEDNDYGIADGQLPFVADEHAGYSVHRLKLVKDAPNPTSHKVFRMEKTVSPIYDDEGNVIDKKIEDVEVDEGMRIICKRKEGYTREDDKSGESEFEFDIDNFSAQYAPFIETLQRDFQEKLNERYDTRQIRDLVINDILLDKMEALNVTRGVYFIEGKDVEALEALKDGLASVDPGMQLAVHHVGKYPDGSMLNRTYESVSGGVTESLLDDAQGILDELTGHFKSDKDTRPSTWIKREQDLKDVKKRVKRMDTKLKLDVSTLSDILDDCTKLIKAGKADSKKDS